MDDLDQALVRLLTADGRRSNVDLARDLGVTEKTVRNRIARLIERDGLRVTARIASSGTQLLFLLHAAPGRRQRLQRELAQHQHVTSVDVATGAADLVVAADFPSSAEALEFQLAVLESSPLVADFAACHLLRGAEQAGPGRSGPSIDRDLLAEFVLGGAAASGGGLEQAMCDALARIFDADHAMLVTSRDRGAVAGDLDAGAIVVVTTGFDEKYANRMRQEFRVAGTPSVTQRVIATGQHVVIEDAHASTLLSATREFVQEAGYLSLAVFPLTFGREVIGFAATYFDRPVHLDTGYLGAVQGYLDHCASALVRHGPA